MKKVILILVGLLIGISTTVYATTIFRSEDITYSSDKTSKKNVKDSLDELYNKVGKCPEGQWCYEEPMTLADKVALGDYIRMTPTSTNYMISKNLTGYTEDQTINPSELNLWRVLKKNDDGTIEIISEYVSTESILFSGKKGYMNLVGTLNLIATQYANDKYVQSARHLGSDGSSDFCSDIALESCSRVSYYDRDKTLMWKAKIPTLGKTPDGNIAKYLSAGRNVDIGAQVYQVIQHEISDTYSFGSLCFFDGREYTSGGGLRPILTLKSYIKIINGDGKSVETAYQLG